MLDGNAAGVDVEPLQQFLRLQIALVSPQKIQAFELLDSKRSEQMYSFEPQEFEKIISQLFVIWQGSSMINYLSEL